MLANNRLPRMRRRFIWLYLTLLLTVIVGLVEIVLLTMAGADPLTAVSLPWKFWAFNLLMVLAFVGRYLLPDLLSEREPTPEPLPVIGPLAVEKERIERWARRGL